jgi:hypothetical protein
LTCKRYLPEMSWWPFLKQTVTSKVFPSISVLLRKNYHIPVIFSPSKYIFIKNRFTLLYSITVVLKKLLRINNIVQRIHFCGTTDTLEIISAMCYMSNRIRHYLCFVCYKSNLMKGTVPRKSSWDDQFKW